MLCPSDKAWRMQIKSGSHLSPGRAALRHLLRQVRNARILALLLLLVFLGFPSLGARCAHRHSHLSPQI